MHIYMLHGHGDVGSTRGSVPTLPFYTPGPGPRRRPSSPTAHARAIARRVSCISVLFGLGHLHRRRPRT